MKKGVIAVIILAFFLSSYVLFQKYYENNDIGTLKDNKLQYNMIFKGLKNAVDFTSDGNGNYYIAYKDRIQWIGKEGKSEELIKSTLFSISSIEYGGEMLYFASGTKIYSFDLKSRRESEIINDLPNYGDYKNSLIKLSKNDLFITIGAVTNSGVVGKDNKWVKENPFIYDITPKTLTIKGKSFGDEHTGAFIPYKTKNISGQIIPSHFPGNSSIIKYNIVNKNSENYAWGIRNVKGMDFDNDGKLIAAVGGMEDRGLRPIKGDVDYIYEIKKEYWYGWPDYSGGDPVTSPRFKGNKENKNSFLLDQHPSTNPPAPLYQHKTLSSLGAIAIDHYGHLNEKNSLYFYDGKDNAIYRLIGYGVVVEEISLSKNSNIASMKFIGDKLMVLEKQRGTLVQIGEKVKDSVFSINKTTVYVLLGIMIFAILYVVRKNIQAGSVEK